MPPAAAGGVARLRGGGVRLGPRGLRRRARRKRRKRTRKEETNRASEVSLTWLWVKNRQMETPVNGTKDSNLRSPGG